MKNRILAYYACALSTAFTATCLGMQPNELCLVNAFKHQTFANTLFKQAAQEGKGITMHPFQFPEKYEGLPVEVSIVSDYSYNEAYIKAVQQALGYTSTEFSVDRTEKATARAIAEVNIKLLEKAFITNCPGIIKELKNEINELVKERENINDTISQIKTKLA